MGGDEPSNREDHRGGQGGNSSSRLVSSLLGMGINRYRRHFTSLMRGEERGGSICIRYQKSAEKSFRLTIKSGGKKGGTQVELGNPNKY